MAETLYLSNVRISFPKLIEATASAGIPNAKKQFGADFIMPASHPAFAQFMSEVGKMATEKWGANAGSVLQAVQTDRLKRCFGNGNEKTNKKYEIHKGYEGMMYVSANSNEDRPPIICRTVDGSEIPNSNTMERSEFARKIYGGCYVNVALRPWAQDNQFGRAIRCELIAVQFNADGPALGEAVADISGMFGAVQMPAAAVAPAMPFPSFMNQV